MIYQTLASTFYQLAKPQAHNFYHQLKSWERKSTAEQEAMQRQWLFEVLDYAYAHVPYYQNLFKGIGLHPTDIRADPTVFEKIPFLSKNIIRREGDQLLTTDPLKKAEMAKIKTGGTTGEPLWLWQSDTYRAYNAAHVYQEMSWSGWEIGQPQAWLWGHVVVGAGSQQSPQKKVKDWFLNRVYSNAFHVTEESLHRFARQVQRKKQVVLWSYVSTMYRFAQHVREHGYQLDVKAVHTAAEPLYQPQREFIEATFNCRVFNSYSCVEIGSIARQCEHHTGLHIANRNCYVEVVRNASVVPDGDEGELILTGLTNRGFPLIRYKVEDWGRKSTVACPCGRGLPLLDVVEGRIIDHFKKENGELVWAAFIIPMMPLLGPVKQYQIVQKTYNLIEMRVIKSTAAPLNEAKFAEIEEAVRTVMGAQVQTRLVYVDSLPQTPTGKHRYTVSEVP